MSGDRVTFTEYHSGSCVNLTFKPEILKEARIALMDRTYILPSVEHPQHDALTSFFAVVIRLHERVEVLEAELKQHKGETT